MCLPMALRLSPAELRTDWTRWTLERVGCDIHPWMRAYLAIIDNPYFGVTGADGSVTLKQVPPGQYVVGVWHEKLGTKELPVKLEAKGTAKLAFTYGAQ